jgi:hypothetical protein
MVSLNRVIVIYLFDVSVITKKSLDNIPDELIPFPVAHGIIHGVSYANKIIKAIPNLEHKHHIKIR